MTVQEDDWFRLQPDGADALLCPRLNFPSYEFPPPPRPSADVMYRML